MAQPLEIYDYEQQRIGTTAGRPLFWPEEVYIGTNLRVKGEPVPDPEPPVNYPDPKRDWELAILLELFMVAYKEQEERITRLEAVLDAEGIILPED